MIQPVFLGKMIIYFENYDPEDEVALYEALGYAAGLSVTAILLTLIHHLYFYHVQRTGMKIRVAMCHMIYKKVGKKVTVPVIGEQTCAGCLLNLCSFSGSVSQ